MNRIYFVLLFLLSSSFLFSEQATILEYNNRAEESMDTNPSDSIYYAKKAFQLNKIDIIPEEYVKSLYIEAYSYSIINESKKVLFYLNSAMIFIKENGYFYNNVNFYKFYGESLFRYGEYGELKDLLNNRNIQDLLDPSSRLEFKILGIKLDIYFSEDGVLESLEELLSQAEGMVNKNSLGEIYLLYGDYEDDRKFYSSALALGIDSISVKALQGLGSLYSSWGRHNDSLNYFERALLYEESESNYFTKLSILNSLESEYKIVNDYKKAYMTSKRSGLLKSSYLSFLLKEEQDILYNGYEKEILRSELKIKDTQLQLLLFIVIALGTLLVVSIVVLFILSYRLRLLKIGTH
ncbi:MAG: hypothetical protein B6229_03510 [Spirochaetaceae bacterium 4572_7]|nr:MAG: hypothetical protein B6229_03510 [Spirochaetaceae bacterium 4572_7]